MKNVMVRAWEIAREGQKNFGGNVKEYFAESLKMAWAEVKEVAVKEVTIAEILGSLPRDHDASRWTKYGKDRLYVNYYTGSGYRKQSGYLELANGVIVRKGIKCDRTTGDIFRKYEGYKVVS